ncbi:MAG: (E)-4-hydroxy-3-methylbut-2-enyl-diphosphate synthase [Alistipes sp.]|nr:(E)-4-hydroxy-3-methylbut-2-enyl-diphosphate synthase [Alistipes sp.]
MKKFCESLGHYTRRKSRAVRVGQRWIGGEHPILVQSMTNTDTNDKAASVAQIERIVASGGEIVRLTAQGRREARNLGEIRAELDRRGCTVPLVADIHFLPSAALEAARWVEKVRINPGNFHEKGGEFEELIARCTERQVALRIGVNHGSLSPAIMEQYGDTIEGMVASAMEFMRRCRALHFNQVVLSVKSSNVRVMVQVYRLLAATMADEGFDFPIHLGVTEAGDDREGRIKSAVGIGALLSDGIGDTIRVSLTEAPEREIPVARKLVSCFAGRDQGAPIEVEEQCYSPYAYRRRRTRVVEGVGGDRPPVLWSELSEEVQRRCVEVNLHTLDQAPEDAILILSTDHPNGYAEQRAAMLKMVARGMTQPVILRRSYRETDPEMLLLRAASDLGPLFLDGFGEGIWIDDQQGICTPAEIDALALDILQSARVRISRTEYIACPSCGRTLYDIEQTLATLKARTAHLVGLKIGVMGCIVNGPGEMADADYGYVGSGPGRITLYRGREVVRRNIPQHEALDALLQLIESDRA